jgi:MerR family copper efflux transcriptional regulator
VTVDAVRVYERQGLIEVPERRSNGYRHYSKKFVRRINFIKWAQTLGFTLKEIKELYP